MILTDEQLKQYQENGYLIVENFIAHHKLDELYENYKKRN